MATKKKRTKKYNPTQHRKDPLSFDLAIRLSRKVDDKTKDDLAKDVHAAILAFESGVAQRVHFDILASTVDVTLMLLNNLFDGNAELTAEVRLAWEGMVRARDRFNNLGKLGLDGQALTAVKRLCAIYDAVIGSITGKELLDFYRQRELAVRHGNYFKGTFEDLKKAA